MIKKYSILIILLVLIASLVGCHFDIKNDIDYPVDLFSQTLNKIEKLQAKSSIAKAQNINFLIYAGDDRDLISLSLPINSAKESAKWALNMDNNGKGETMGKIKQKLGDVNLDKLDFLDRMGPGLLAQIEVNESKNTTHVLIWLD